MNALAYNTSIRGLLADLAELNPKVGPIEFICMWFDDLYRPGETRPSSYSLEVWEKGLQEWKECFSDEELSILSRFHEIYAYLVDSLPTKWPEWEQDAGWQTIKSAAAEALTELKRCRPDGQTATVTDDA